MTYFQMREKAYEDPDEALRVQLEEARVAWETDVLQTFMEQVLELLPREQSTCRRHQILFSSPAQPFSPPGLPQNTPSKLPRRSNLVNARDVDDSDGEYDQTSSVKEVCSI